MRRRLRLSARTPKQRRDRHRASRRTSPCYRAECRKLATAAKSRMPRSNRRRPGGRARAVARHRVRRLLLLVRMLLMMRATRGRVGRRHVLPVFSVSSRGLRVRARMRGSVSRKCSVGWVSRMRPKAGGRWAPVVMVLWRWLGRKGGSGGLGAVVSCVGRGRRRSRLSRISGIHHGDRIFRPSFEVYLRD